MKPSCSPCCPLLWLTTSEAPKWPPSSVPLPSGNNRSLKPRRLFCAQVFFHAVFIFIYIFDTFIKFDLRPYCYVVMNKNRDILIKYTFFILLLECKLKVGYSKCGGIFFCVALLSRIWTVILTLSRSAYTPMQTHSLTRGMEICQCQCLIIEAYLSVAF